MRTTKGKSGSQSGAALVIAIFSLLLISVIATALIVTAGTQSAMKANYKSAMQAFYDAKAGLEEARGRLWANNPNSIAGCVFPPGGGIMTVGQVCYITNGAGTEVVDPTDPNDPYYDAEYIYEWMPFSNSGASITRSLSTTQGIAGPLYKWVRITPRTEQSANFDADADGSIGNTPLFFDGQNVVDSKGGGAPVGAAQILTVTSFAKTPYGSQRMVQYTVAAATFSSALANFPSALTLDGNGVTFTPPSTSGGHNGNFQINGTDVNGSGSPTGVPAIGYTNSSDASTISGAAMPAANYQSPQNPAIGQVTLPPLLQTPSGLQTLVDSIKQGADLVITPPNNGTADQSSLTGMSASNPMVVVVNGDFHLTHGGGGAFTGYGLLVVTGTFRYDPDDSWNGVILVIGKGVFNGSQGGRGGQINGTVLVANTLDNSGNLLNSLGPASYNQTGGGNGIQYSSSAVKSAQALMPYQVLSFREIAQTTP
jgi:hypothetical protein